MPPEQMLGDVQAMGPACDIYSLGVVLYELLTGGRPFQGDALALVAQVTLDDPPPPSTRRPGLDPRLDAVCLRALAKKPDQRWPSMRDFADALTALLRPFPAFLTSGAGRLAPPSPAALGPDLTLRIAGTPFAYRPMPGQAIITVGRQKRKPGEPSDQGNDVVVRVPGNDPLSTRISRRHLEIHRQGGQLILIDHSKVGTLHNGQPVSRDVPTPLASGDRLVIAGVLTLEVVLEAVPTVHATRSQVELPQAAGRATGLILEATLGDLVTLE